MQHYNIPEDSDASSFDSPLWKACFDMLFALLGSEEVVIEAFGPQVRFRPSPLASRDSLNLMILYRNDERSGS